MKASDGRTASEHDGGHAEGPLTVSITINGLAGHLCDIDAQLKWVIADVKKGVQAKLGVPTFQQKLFAKDKELDDRTPLIESVSANMEHFTLKDLDFMNGTVFTLVRQQAMPDEFITLWQEDARRGGVPSALRSDRTTVLSVLQQLPEGFAGALAPAAPALRAEQEVVLAAVRRHGCALKDASAELQADRAVVLSAVQQSGHALEFACQELKADRAIVQAAVQVSGQALKHAAPQFQADRDIVIAAITQDHAALQFASRELRSDREVILVLDPRKAVTQAGDDRTIVIRALQANPSVIWAMADKWWSDTQVMLAALKADGWLLGHMPAEYRTNKQMVLTAVQSNGWALSFAAEALRSNREVVSKAVQKDGLALQYASPALRADRAIAEMAVRQQSCAFHHVAPELQADRDFRLFADRLIAKDLDQSVQVA